ncbi:thialysine N-epsilon-acetyltransferase-like [Diadema antillarum]|uniref:thialysine N-epsilon-acetyltransferase-like n=1 Tax=Diadema antillarum TaxID=105358 RepID=UPI003A836562
MQTSCEIRRGRIDDAEPLFDLIRELATFENIPPERFYMTVEGVRDHVLSGSPTTSCLVMEDMNSHTKEPQLVGFAIYCHIVQCYYGKTAFLNAVYVKNSHRKKGLATALIQAAAKDVKDSGCVSMTFNVYKWNKDAVRLYEKMGALDLSAGTDQHIFTFRREQLTALVETETAATCRSTKDENKCNTEEN